ncbi:MAG: DNA translocase FtsK 4TM domain-containing protein [Pararhodobacter sp.]
MASYPSPQRQPLLDQRLQQTLSQRGKELLGLGLIAAGALLALILGSYSPEDPSWMATSDGPVHNALGRAGAAVAAPLIIIAGKAGWGLALALAGWGLRLVLHRGEETIIGRSIFAPIAVALTSLWLATLVPGGGWALGFGMGGMFGDTVLGALLTMLPLTSTAGLNLLTLATFALTVGMWLYVLGTSLRELKQIARFLMIGFILSYAGLVAVLVTVLGGGLRGLGRVTGRAVQGAYGSYQTRRAVAAAHRHGVAPAPGYGHAYADPSPDPRHGDWQEASDAPRPARVLRAEPMIAQAGARAPLVAAPFPAPLPVPPGHAAAMAVQPMAEGWADPAPRPGLLARVLGRRATEAPAADDMAAATHDGQRSPTEAAGDERIRSRISDVIRARQRQMPSLRAGRADPPLTPTPGRIEPILAAAAPRAPQPSAPGLAFNQPAPGQKPGQVPGQVPGIPPATAFHPLPPTAQPTAQPALQPLVEQADLYPDLDDDDELLVETAFGNPSAPPQNGGVLNRRVVQTAPRRPLPPSRQAQAEAQPRLQFDERRMPAFELPPLALLADPGRVERYTLSDEALEENARMLESVLDDYGVRGEIVSVRPGPVVTMYELEPAPGLKASRVIGLADDIARSMSALSARVSTVPGRSVIGIELPNARREKVVLREILGARDFGDTQMRLPLALGKDIGGEPVVANLAKMPHLLIAGTTGSGKSVAINTMILSLLYKLTPEECRLIMIDPKMLELSVYDGIPHLLSPVVTDPKKAVVALKWVVGEMEERYRKMSKMGVRNIEGFNGRVREALARGEMFKRTVQTGFDDATGDPVFETEEFAPELLPFIVVIVDEMADLMMVAGKEIEACIQRLAQMARASGIHLIMATQRPSVDVITGTIKANFPTRISFQVTSKIDSRTILGEQGAEQLLGMGDMLYMAGGAKITRIHGPFVSDEEVEEVVNHLKSFGPAEYMHGVLDGPDAEREADIDAVLGLGDSGGEDALYDQAVAIVAKDRKCSTSYIQRKLGIGYNKAARLVEQMEAQGVVTPANHVGKREILVPESH